MAHWWRRDELLALLHAWEQAVDIPRDRDEITEREMHQLCMRFDALRPRDSVTVSVQEVEAQRQRLLPTQQQDDLRRMNGRLGELATVTPDEFDLLRRICEEVPAPPPVETTMSPIQSQRQDRPLADEMKAAAEALAGLPMFRSNQTPAPPPLSPPLSSIDEMKTINERTDFKQEETSDSDNLSDSESEDEETKRKSRKREEDLDYSPPKIKSKTKVKMTSKWSKREEHRLLLAWHEIVTVLSKNGFEGSFASRNDGLRLNALIHQRYIELCGDNDTPRTNQSSGAKKHAIMTAFRALRNVLRTLASQSDRPNWFGMTPEERMELQKKYGHHNEQAVFIEKESYQRLVQIDKAQQIVLTPTADAPRPPTTLDELLGRKKEQVFKRESQSYGKLTPNSGPPRSYMIADKSSEESNDDESEDDNASLQSRSTETSNRRANSQVRPNRYKSLATKSTREVDPVDDRETSVPYKRRRMIKSDPKWVTQLLETQTRRFEALLDEFQEERRQERQHNVEIILEALNLRRAIVQKSDQPSQFVEMLVERQRQHLLSLFNQLQDEHSREREQARSLLRELGSARLVSQDQHEKD
ncbi:uncharacterized protein PHALS_08102 [Plasmopara halstedii]|uniref:Uncharacterized protein n=1 Tax=Plasmopara halstedii TaxID=4781 RepID=A0A0P1B6C9_PLAHL|nr:uncharacterized protein PHALS_08102 [Plasmopara halstedii]CEG50390.1 hypothetical protein PHALS_08102 [Plasmopara halstedii]|eukprot:XP_024586759.1 hypothetical protein PHALS_08102 [Plasmopara halstedii]